jgi:predicted RecB family nuclease
MLYNLVQCPKRLDLDIHGDPSMRDEISPFVQMLWERGAAYEREVMASGGMNALDLSQAEGDEKERLTFEAMQRGEPLIYSGRIRADDLLGIPDLLRKSGGGYIPIDIKSGSGEEGGDDDSDGKPKLPYAVQLALYVDILERLGLSSGRQCAILDVRGALVPYNLDEPRGPRTPGTLWDVYQAKLAEARSIIVRETVCLGALASACKLCHWHSACSSELRTSDDLTLIPMLGRAIRDAMADQIATVADLAAINPEGFINGKKTTFPGVGPDRLRTFHERAKLLSDPNGKPMLKAPVMLPRSHVEHFFDIEVDPMRDFTYLHGIVERRGGDDASERFIAFFAEDETPESERQAFANSFAFLTADPTATIWYYSKYERTLYRKLQARYPDVCSAEDIERLFDPARTIDLYFDVVMKATEWPTNDHSIKTLAKYLGFSWRDNNPSGAASIEWFDQWVQTRDPAIRQRILDYNEDDCKATRVLLDGIRGLSCA